MRLTGADISSDTGCWQAAAFQNARSFRAVRLREPPPLSAFSACVSATSQLTHATSTEPRCTRIYRIRSPRFR